MSSTESIDLQKALGERYLAYALSTIMSRSLPDVRDGLKPVHRRLIYAMHQLRLNPKSNFKKSARVVGDVMGKFHPHGDMAIYDALVRLAQDFSVRYPLIDGQGNFGNIDGDNAAAMRYTEARLTPIATLLLEGLEENAIDFRSTYDGESEEPLVFPAAFPNILANGAVGIAVGMATSIPPHNLGELCQALIHLIDNPQATTKDLMTFIPGPDFPTGGVLVENADTIEKAYETGRGSFRVRAKWASEPLKGGSYRIIVTQIPYQISKSKLIEKIANLLLEKKLPLLGDVVDESADDIRIVLEPKNRSVDPEILMESLFKNTDLESRFPLNMNVLDGGSTPRVMALGEVLQAFLNHKQVVLQRRSAHRLEQIDQRLELLSGYLIAYLNLDEVIRIIREEDEPKQALIERFSLTDNQAEAILNMRLRALRKLQEIEIREEYAGLEQEKNHLTALLGTPKLQWSQIKTEIKNINKAFGLNAPDGQRRTLIGKEPTIIDIPIEAVVEKEDVTVICSQKGWIRCVKGHTAMDAPTDIKYKDGDEEGHIIPGQTTDKLLICATNGRFYTLGVDKLPRGKGHGNPIREMIDLEPSDEIIYMGLLPQDMVNTQQYLLASHSGRGFLVNAADTIAQTKTGKQIMNIGDEDQTAACLPVIGDLVAIIGENRKLLIFKISDLPVMARGKGVTLQKYKQGGNMADIIIFKEEDGISLNKSDKKSTAKDIWIWSGRRGGIGRLAPVGFSRQNKFK